LPSASDITLGKEPKPVPRSVLFAECYDPDTRQRIQHSAKPRIPVVEVKYWFNSKQPLDLPYAN
jgi:hypothetical protein